jgi:hypothetical protein
MNESGTQVELSPLVQGEVKARLDILNVGFIKPLVEGSGEVDRFETIVVRDELDERKDQ